MSPLTARAVSALLAACALCWALPARAQAPRYEVKTESTPAPAPAPAKPAGDGDQAGEAPAPPEVTRGASWTDKPRRTRSVRRRRFDKTAAYATFPGFRMNRDGTSQIWVHVSRTVPVTKNEGKGRVTYVLSGARVYIRNNTHPLVTTYFNTPAAGARLIRGEDGAQLVVDLRDDVKAQHRVVDGPGPTMLLVIDLPKPTKRVVPKSSPRNPRGTTRAGTTLRRSATGPANSYEIRPE